MKQLFCLFVSIFLLQYLTYGQSLSINTDGSTANASALLDVKSTVKGVLIPRMTRAQRDAISSPATGLMIFQNAPDIIGLYYYNGTGWTWVLANSNADSLAWRTGGNTGTVDGTSFIGTRDNVDLTIRVNNERSGVIQKNNNQSTALGYQALKNETPNIGLGSTAIGYQALYSQTNASFTGENTAIGYSSLYSNTTGYGNTAIGSIALYGNTTGSLNTATGAFALWHNISGVNNTATGVNALNTNSTGNTNTATGESALHQNTTGYSNVAMGVRALYSNSTISNLIALGDSSLYSNTTGIFNTAIGSKALYSNTSGSQNTANGYQALYNNSTGAYNTANGRGALYSNTIGNFNTANGFSALYYNTTGIYNTANGSYALINNATGNYNTANGWQALYTNGTGSQNTANGYQALFNNTTGIYNTALGYSADVSSANLSNATAIGNGAIVNASNKIRLGNAAVTVIEGQVAYTFPSDGRFKTNISEQEVKGLEFIKRLRPVVYNFDTRKYEEFITKNMADSIRQRYLKDDFAPSTSIRQSGFIAQEVEKAANESGYNFNGIHKPENENDHYSLAYSQFVVPLVKGMQEQQQMIDKLLQENERQQKISDKLRLANETQQQQIDELQKQVEQLVKGKN